MAGLASLISYPALLAVGLAPVAANVTNTVALVFSGIGSALGSRVELAGQRSRLRRLGAAAAAGGAVGAGLLLLTPSGAFEAVVPVLIATASVLVLLAPAPSELTQLATGAAGPWLTAGIFGVGVYGGYFGAAAGVMMLAMLLMATGETTVRAIAAKNALLGLANGVAALAYVLLGPVSWTAALPLAVGFLAGGWAGPTVARRAPARLLRLLVGLAGLALAAYLARNAYR
ncbi:MAG: sulfite exporter TauE/SafE family protein [Actinomycetota bacterium]|nr:sulfite exporter TauE/SafE family protein [Actinomycetota bacterium]